MTNPYQSPNDPQIAAQTNGLSATQVLKSAIVFSVTAIGVYFVGRYYLGLADGSNFPNWSLCIVFLAFPISFLMQPMTTFGIYFCEILSCMIWGFIAVKSKNWIVNRRVPSTC